MFYNGGDKDDLLLVVSRKEKMEEVMYIMFIVACVTFVVKTIYEWVDQARYKHEREIREAENIAGCKARWQARLEALEKVQKDNEERSRINETLHGFGDILDR